MVRAIAIAALLALAGCDRAAPDGYAFGSKEFDRQAITVTVVEHSGEAALRKEAARLGIQPEGRKLMAFGFVGRDQPVCTIHVVDPAVNYRPEWIGHELVHCLHGRWHP